MLTFLSNHNTFITAFFAGYMLCYGLVSITQQNWLLGGLMIFASILNVIFYCVEKELK